MGLLTYVQFITVDSLAGIYVPLVKQRGYLFFYFAALIIIVSVGIMNLVTATLEDKSLAQSQNDADLKKRKILQLRPQIARVFQSMDDNEDHTLTRSELVNCIDELPDILKDVVQKGGIGELFELLDKDGSGEISEEEFMHGVFQLMFSDSSPATIQELKLLRHLKKKSEDITTALMKIGNTLEGLRESQSQLLDIEYYA